MSLQDAIGEAVEASGEFIYTPWTEPVLETIAYGGDDRVPVVSVRYAGSVLLGQRRRSELLVRCVVATSHTAGWADGEGVEAVELSLHAILERVPNCFPSLLPSRVDYQHQIGPQRRGQRIVNTYIAILMRVMGP